MSELEKQETEFSRLLRTAPFDDGPRSEHCDALRDKIVAGFDKAQSSDAAPYSWKSTLHRGREIMRRPIPRLIAVSTACLAIAACWLFVPGRQSTAQAYNTLAEAIVAAKTLRFQMEVQVEGQPKQRFQAYYLAPGKFRQELPGQVNVSDLKAGKIVTTIPDNKLVMVLNIKPDEKGKRSSDTHFDRLRELLAKTQGAKEDQYERLAAKEIGGKRVAGFRYDSPAETVTLWGDPATGQPVRIETVWSGLPRTEVVMTDFEINVELKESLFDLTPPAGYKVQSIEVDSSPPGEPALIEAFKTCSDVGGGEFPETMDTAGVTKLIIKYALSHLKDGSDDSTQELMKKSIAIGRGFQFGLTLPDSADAHYAGKGVKRDAPDQPIFWYKPAGAESYRVVYADLTVKDSATAPQVKGAKRIEKASQSAKPAGK